MSGKSISRYVLIGLAVFLIAGLFLVDSNAQKRKRKRRPASPRITNPEIYQPANENSNSNSSGDTTTAADNTNANTAKPQSEPDPESMKKTIQTLSHQVDK